MTQKKDFFAFGAVSGSAVKKALKVEMSFTRSWGWHETSNKMVLLPS